MTIAIGPSVAAAFPCALNTEYGIVRQVLPADRTDDRIGDRVTRRRRVFAIGNRQPMAAARAMVLRTGHLVGEAHGAQPIRALELDGHGFSLRSAARNTVPSQ